MALPGVVVHYGVGSKNRMVAMVAERCPVAGAGWVTKEGGAKPVQPRTEEAKEPSHAVRVKVVQSDVRIKQCKKRDTRNIDVL